MSPASPNRLNFYKNFPRHVQLELTSDLLTRYSLKRDLRPARTINLTYLPTSPYLSVATNVSLERHLLSPTFSALYIALRARPDRPSVCPINQITRREKEKFLAIRAT